MPTPSYYSFKGHLIFNHPNRPLTHARVELIDGNDVYGWLGSATSDANGYFSINVTTDIGDLIDDHTIAARVNVYHDGTQVFSTTISTITEVNEITIPVASYDNITPDATHQDEVGIEFYSIIRGFISSTTGIPIQASITLSELGFRTSAVIAVTDTNEWGRYEIKVAGRQVGATVATAGRMLQIQALTADGHNANATLTLNASEIICDLKVEGIGAASQNEFSLAVAAIQKITASAAISGISDEGIDSEAYYLSKVTELSIGTVQRVIAAYKYAASTSINPKFFYALIQMRQGFDLAGTIGFTKAEIIAGIKAAIAHSIIGTASEEEITTAAAALFDLNTDVVKTSGITAENIEFGEALNTVFDDEELVDKYLASSINFSSNNRKAFWDTFTLTNSEADTQKLKKGFQLLAITGFQPEMAAYLMSNATTVHGLAKKTVAEWETIINTVKDLNTIAGRLVVPRAIAGPNAETVTSDAIHAYAVRLRAITQRLYPFTAIAGKLEESGGASLIEDSDLRTQAYTFLNNNPKFDLRFKSVHQINPLDDYDLTDVTDVNTLKESLEPFQRVARITGGKPDAISALISSGLKSALEVSSVSESAFVSEFSQVLGGAPAAKTAYSAAKGIAGASLNAYMNMSLTLTNDTLTESPVWPGWTDPSTVEGPEPGPDTPDLGTLFGPQEKCSCDYCMSVYSPAAYYTDIMHFVMNLDSPSASVSNAYIELSRRRPDLPYIDLTCKNSNTPLPYVDLINELLELVVLRQLASASPPVLTTAVPKSFQTMGKAAELGARPEHIIRIDPAPATPPVPNYYAEYADYKAVYDEVLSKASYPDNLPFNLALEEARVYLKHLGVPRYELMQRYRPMITAGIPTSGNTLYNRNSEYLGISKEAADIITDTSGVATWNYYGFRHIANATTGYVSGYHSPINAVLNGAWDNLLMGKIIGGGVDVLMQQLKISNKELQQLLKTRFLNPVDSSTGLRGIAIAAKTATPPAPAIPPDTCVLSDLELYTTLSTTEVRSFLSRLHRFVRLWRASGLDIYAVDRLLHSIGATDIDTAAFNAFVLAKILADRIGKSPDYITVWISDIDTERYTDFNSERQDPLPSFYDQLFRNKSVRNPPDPEFSVFSGSQPTFSVSYQDHTAAIAAAIGVTERELLGLMEARQILVSATISLQELGVLLGMSSIAAGLGWSIADFLLFLEVAGVNITGINPTTGLSVLSIVQEYLVNRSDAIQGSPFSLKELHYILQNEDDDKAFIPKEQTVQLFYESLRGALKKIDSTNNTLNQPDALKNAVVQQFSAHFGVEADIIKYLTGELIEVHKISSASATIHLLDALTDSNFISGIYDLSYDNASNSGSLNPLPDWQLEELYHKYYLIAKIVFIVKRLSIRQAELKVLQDYHSPQLGLFDMRDLPVKAGDPALYSTQMTGYAHWFAVRDRLRLDKTEFVKLAGGLFPTTGALSLSDWKALVADVAGWDYDELQELVGYNLAGSPSTPIGALSIRFPQDFANPEVLTAIADIMDTNKRIGMTAGQLLPVVKSSLILDDAHKIMQVARARYTEAGWLSVAKPLHDQLREQQRAALVAYVLANPPAGEHWLNENELFAYLLIDVEMKPCMMTSRIKQAISTVQLYVDRLVMNLEYLGAGITPINKDRIKEWKTWRKWYRIWEANRKVFIYPENWIEPELRDNKTPFFKELETQLLQDEVKTDKVEDAVYAYLEKLDEVARLEPVSTYRQSEPELGIDITHMVARSYAEPRHYYYRKLEHNEWSAWEAMNLEIKGDHVTMVMWNRRLHIYWLTFIEKMMTNGEIINLKGDISTGVGGLTYGDRWINQIQYQLQTDDQIGDRFKYFEVLLNWSERKEGKWLAPKVSKDSMELKPHKVQLNFRNLYMYSPSSGIPKPDVYNFFNYLAKNKELQIHEVFKNRIYLLPTFEGDSLIFSICFCAAATEEYFVSMHAFICDDSSTDPRVFRENHRKFKFLAPNNTLANKMKFEEWEAFLPYRPAPYTYRNTGTLDTIGTGWIPDTGGYFIYNWGGRYNPPEGYMPVHSTDQAILNKTPYPPFRITARSDMNIGVNEINPMFNDFSYEDKPNNFFIRQVAVNKYASEYGAGTSDGLTFEDAIDGYNNDYRLPLNVDEGPIDGPLPGSIWETEWKYYFQTFFHPHIHRFMKTLNRDGISGLLNIGMQDITDTLDFANRYQPTSLVAHTYYYPYPTNVVDFKFDGAYSQYNWELFFHIPMLVAGGLSTNQQFEDAQKWYHYIFDPTSNTDAAGNYSPAKARFWKFRPFYEQASGSSFGASFFTSYAQQIEAWEDNPFQPHLIARMRILAYMKNVVMKYIDNLIGWGDQLFRRNTIESINEATQLYVLAANILGPRPQEVSVRATHAYDNFDDLVATGTLDQFSNALVKIETFFEPNAFPKSTSTTSATSVLKMSYFCTASNEKLLGYWDTVADRLFKIRNCMNIEGAKQQLPLFEPPIDPAMLVRAAAAGVDINSVLDEASGAFASPYRFSYVVQKANELAGDVRALGGAILSALEKKDAEGLALLRSGQEISLLDKVTYIKQSQLDDAKNALEVLQKTRENIQQRFQYYSSRPFMNFNEQRHLSSIQLGAELQSQQAMNEAYAAGLSMIPQFHGQVTFAVGASFGGQQISTAMRAVSSIMGIQGIINNARGTMAATTGGYERRRDDWTFQADTAKKELEQTDKQIIGAQIRINIAERELANHLQQIENSKETDAYMRRKFSNGELYNWMTTQLAAVYFQSYQLAYDLAAKAEKCYEFELPLAISKKPAGGFIRFGYWDSLRKGLLSGERLQYDLRKMEHSYLEENKRGLELTKHISLAMLDPQQLLQLITANSSGVHKCNVSLPEWIFDMDYPGHYMRRIKSVSLSIPCVAGPYTTISCKLTLNSSKYRKTTSLSGGYAEVTGSTSDPRFEIKIHSGKAIATSQAQNDSGMFELSFRDERYLPFEGAGAISDWEIELPSPYPQFDYNSISDVILHINYTAADDGALVSGASANVNTILTNAANAVGFMRLFDLRHEFATEWAAYANAYTVTSKSPLKIGLRPEMFALISKGKKIELHPERFIAKINPTATSTVINSISAIEISYYSSGTTVTTVSYAVNLLNGYASFEPSAVPNTTIKGNMRLLKLVMKNASGQVMNMDSILEELYLVTRNYLPAAISLPIPADDTDWPDSGPLPPLSGLQAWWKADAGVTHVGGDVDAWADQSGAGNNLTAAASTLRPSFNTSGGANSQPYMSFNGSKSLYASSLILPTTPDLTTFIVCKSTSASSVGVFMELSNNFTGSSGGLCTTFNDGVNNTIEASHNGNTGYSIAAAYVPASTWMYVRVENHKSKSSQEAAPYVNGGAAGTLNPFGVPASNNTNNFSTSAPLYVGSRTNSAYYLNADVAEVLIYDHALNSTEISNTENYLKTKYGL